LYGSFVRTVSLPDGIDDEKVKAKFKDGVLNLTSTEVGKGETKSH
jgi:HSP20 family protein